MSETNILFNKSIINAKKKEIVSPFHMGIDDSFANILFSLIIMLADW